MMTQIARALRFAGATVTRRGEQRVHARIRCVGVMLLVPNERLDQLVNSASRPCYGAFASGHELRGASPRAVPLTLLLTEQRSGVPTLHVAELIKAAMREWKS